MNTDIVTDDEDISELAVRGLTEATAQAQASGHPVVLLKDGKLVRITAEGEVILKQIPPRFKVGERKRRVGS